GELEDEGERGVYVRDTIAPLLSGAADEAVWKAVRPACLALALGGVLLGFAAAGLVVGFALYASVALAQWARGFGRGFELGAELGARLDEVLLSRAVMRAAHAVVAIAAGAWLVGGLAHAGRTSAETAFL